MRNACLSGLLAVLLGSAGPLPTALSAAEPPAPLLYQLGGTPDPAAQDGEAKTLTQDGIYCWWAGPPLRPGYFEVIARARTRAAPGVLHFVLVDANDEHKVHYAISQVQRQEVTASTYQELYCGTFYWDGGFAPRLSDWSSGGLLVDWVKLVPVAAAAVRDPLPQALRRYEAPRLEAPPTVDGDLREWTRVPPLLLGPESARSGAYRGSADLSATCRFAWDATHLYIAAEVTDDRADFLPDARHLEDLWQYDSIQIAFDAAGNARTPGYAPDDYEYGFGATATGAKAYRWVAGNNLPLGDVPTIEVAVVRDAASQATRYEIAIPFKELVPFSPETAHCGMNVVINDRDGNASQRGWLEWTPGITGAKDPSAFGELRLVAAPPAAQGIVATLITERDLSTAPAGGISCRLQGPEPPGACRLHWRVRREGAAGAPALLEGDQEVAGERPDQSLPLQIDLERLPQGRFVLSAELRRDGQTLASAEASCFRFAVADLQARLAQVRVRLAADLERLQVWRAAGGHGDYPRATLGAVEEFARYLEADLAKTCYERAESALADVEQLLNEAEEELARISADPATDLAVPGLPAARITVRDGVFYAGDEPQLLIGYCGWWDVWTGVPRLTQQGLNHLEDSVVSPACLFPSAGATPDKGIDEALRWGWEKADAAGTVYSRMLACNQVPATLATACPGAMGGGWGGMCTLDPGLQAFEQQYLRAVTAATHGRRSTGMYVLYGENTHSLSADPRETAAFAAHLRSEYETLAALNAAWGTQFAAWEGIGNAQSVASPVAWHDRGRFNQQLFTTWSAWLRAQVRAADPEALCTGYPSLLSWDDSSDFSAGIDMEALCRTFDVNGFDTAALDYGGKRWAMSSITGFALAHDLLQAFNPRQPNYDPELHLVNLTVRYPDAYVRAAVLQGCLHGMSAANLWVFQRNEGMDSMLVFQPRVMATYLRTALDLRRLVRPVIAFQRAPSEVAILYSLTSVAYNPSHLPELRALYEGLFFSDCKVSFVSERGIAEGALGGRKILLLPAASHVPLAVAQDIAAWAAGGGHLVCVGDCLQRDPRNLPLPPLSGPPGKITGIPACGDPGTYRAALEPLLGRTISRPFRSVDEKGAPLDGVEMRTLRSERGLLVYAINMNTAPVTFDLAPRPPGVLTELRSVRPLQLPCTLAPLDVVLFQAAGE